MKNLTQIYGIVSMIFLGVLAVSPMKDYFTEWRKYQEKYNQVLEQQPKRLKPERMGLKQIWVQEFNRVDRCVTCHLGIEEPALKKAAQPFRTHPSIYHNNFQELGCTLCHYGQGLATSTGKAHGNVRFWDEPILDRKFLEASCGKCHKTPEVPNAPLLTRGKKLLEQANCVACHKIVNISRQWTPDLNGIGSKVNRDWMIRWLKDPKQYFPKTKMPNFRLTEEEAAILSDFLMTFKTFEKSLEPFPAQFSRLGESEKEKLIQLGRTRFNEARCVSCHSMNGKGGTQANDLGKIASKLGVQWLYNYLKNPRELQPEVEMPHYRFSEKERIAVALYMMEEFVDYDIPEDTTAHPLAADPGFYEKGEKLFRNYNCGGCHDLKNIRKNEEMGPELTYLGSKKIYEIEFGKISIEHTLPDFIFTKIKSPRIFTANSKMPDYQFTDDEAVAISTALLSFTREEIPEKYKMISQDKSSYFPQGSFGQLVNDLACFACHKIYGRGGEMAPDLSREASQVQGNWLKHYFKVPYSLRPILTERMPNLFLTDSEINVIADYFQQVLVDDSLSIQLSTGDTEKIALGKQLYFEKYGCQSCHQMNSEGGYVGPPLDQVGIRLKPGWIFRWLKNPQKYKPATIEPNNRLTDAEAEALTIFLMSLREK